MSQAQQKRAGHAAPVVIPTSTTERRLRPFLGFAAGVLQACGRRPVGHEHWRRHRHDAGCQCGTCARWRHVERHGPRGRPGGGEL